MAFSLKVISEVFGNVIYLSSCALSYYPFTLVVVVLLFLVLSFCYYLLFFVLRLSY